MEYEVYYVGLEDKTNTQLNNTLNQKSQTFFHLGFVETTPLP